MNDCGYYCKSGPGPWCKSEDYVCPDLYKCHSKYYEKVIE